MTSLKALKVMRCILQVVSYNQISHPINLITLTSYKSEKMLFTKRYLSESPLFDLEEPSCLRDNAKRSSFRKSGTPGRHYCCSLACGLVQDQPQLSPGSTVMGSHRFFK
ncbi:unnamed protein product, partial [Brassica napus]